MLTVWSADTPFSHPPAFSPLREPKASSCGTPQLGGAGAVLPLVLLFCSVHTSCKPEWLGCNPQCPPGLGECSSSILSVLLGSMNVPLPGSLELSVLSSLQYIEAGLGLVFSTLTLPVLRRLCCVLTLIVH